MLYGQLLGADDCDTRENAEVQLRYLNREYDLREPLTILTKSPDAEIRKRAKRIIAAYFPKWEEKWPLFHSYARFTHDEFILQQRRDNYTAVYEGYVEPVGAKNESVREYWVCNVPIEQQRELTRVLVDHWLAKGKTVQYIERQLKIMQYNEKHEIFFYSWK